MTPEEVVFIMLKEDLAYTSDSISHYLKARDNLSLRRLQVALSGSLIRTRMISRIREAYSEAGISTLEHSISCPTNLLSDVESLWDRSLG